MVWYLYLSESPRSHFETDLSLIPSCSASCFCVRPSAFLFSAIYFPILTRSIEIPPFFEKIITEKGVKSHPLEVESLIYLLQFCEFGVGQFYVPCAEVFEDSLLIFRSWDWNDADSVLYAVWKDLFFAVALYHGIQFLNLLRAALPNI